MTIRAGGFEICRLLIDDESSCNILSLNAFSQMGSDRSNLKKETDGLVGFTSHEVSAIGTITLPLTIGTWTKVASEMIQFVVVDMP